jgi:hypothetical protein
MSNRKCSIAVCIDGSTDHGIEAQRAWCRVALADPGSPFLLSKKRPQVDYATLKQNFPERHDFHVSLVMQLANIGKPFLYLRGTETAGKMTSVVFNYKTPFCRVHLSSSSNSRRSKSVHNHPSSRLPYLPHLLTHLQLLYANNTTIANMSSAGPPAGPPAGAPGNATGASGGPYVYHLCPNAGQAGHPATYRFVVYARRECDHCQVSCL